MALPASLASQKTAANFRDRLIKVASVLYSDTASDTAARVAGKSVWFGSGEGVPTGSLGLNQRGVWLREDASSANGLMYFTIDGSTWEPVDASLSGSVVPVTDTAAPANYWTTDTAQGVADELKAAIGGTNSTTRAYAVAPVYVGNNDSVVVAIGKLDQAAAAKGSATSSAGTGASGSATTGITASSADSASATTGISASSAATASGTASISVGGSVSNQVVTLSANLGALAAPGTAFHAQFAAGAPIDESAGITNVFPRRAAQIVLGAGGANPVNYTLDWTKADGSGTSELIVATGPGTYQGAKSGILTRIRSDVNPGGTTDVQTGNGYGVHASSISNVFQGIDGVIESPAGIDMETGTVTPTTVPNGTHVYAVGYQAQHGHPATGLTASDAGHSHVAGAVSVTDTGHVHASGAVSVTDTGHTHTGPAHTHSQN